MEMLQFSNKLLQNETALKNLALQLTRNSQDAEDLFQETFCKALEYREKYRSDSCLGAWLYVIMRNIFINMYRRKKRSLKLFRTVADSTPAMNSIELSYRLDTCDRPIKSQIAQLPNHYQTPLVLYLEGYKYLEISELLAEPLGTIKGRIFFARKILKSIIERS
ncbi:RNA polymerase sigma factor [Danxiaibacter flavus]|uniref:RNA polymerase sigma factor n=1 Tax=Danxiaibacter flavus TaxID=3049108 RepID=A0ABV3ZL09_9BACT|nr:RNA polymerase sigma factor [Chitinophagaceae bacterium DXS]